MSRNATFAVVLTGLTLFLGLGIVWGLRNKPSLPVETSAACALSMDQILESGMGDVYNFEGVTDFEEPELYYLAVYEVNGDELANPEFDQVPADYKDEQDDAALQQDAWNLFAELIPAEDRQMVTQYNVFTDGYSNTLAAVDQSRDDPSLWILEVDIADLEDKDTFISTLIHEYAHILTLNASQVEPDIELVQDPYNLVLQKEKDLLCSTYFVGNGCSRPDSYIQAFYTRFWTSVDSEWRSIDAMQYQTEDFVPYYNALYGFYKKYQDQFVSDYSVTHPAEDIAEAFTHFVLSPKPAGESIRDQKLLFFYEYPELVELRDRMLNATCTLD